MSCSASSASPLPRRPAAFLDRDGVLNVDVNYLHKIEDFCWMPGAPEALRLLHEAGYYIFVVTNQSGIARDYYSEDAVQTLHHWLREQAEAHGGAIDDFRFCPHHVKGVVPELAIDCGCRKPKPGMLEDLLQHWPVDLSRSFIIGDKLSDLAAGAAIGIAGYHYTSGRLDDLAQQALRDHATTPASAMSSVHARNIINQH